MKKIRAGAEVVLSMRRGRVIKDRKKYYLAHCCRKSKAQRRRTVCITE